MSFELIKFNSIPIEFSEVLSFENSLLLRRWKWNKNKKCLNENKHPHKYVCHV